MRSCGRLACGISWCSGRRITMSSTKHISPIASKKCFGDASPCVKTLKLCGCIQSHPKTSKNHRIIGHFDNLINLTIPAVACLAHMFPNNMKTYLSHLSLILMTPYERRANTPFQTAGPGNTSVHPEPSHSLKATGPFISPSLKTSRPEYRSREILLDSDAMCMAHLKSSQIFNLT